MDERWKTNPGCVYNVSYHIIWCPKYRRKLLTGEVEIRLKELLTFKSEQNGWEIKKMEIMPDHVHVFIKATPSDSIAHIVSQLKGFTAYQLRSEFPHLKTRVPTLWTRSYYVETIGHISEKTITQYIQDQKNK
ncbi:IS200/IS605 family transposase [Bacteroides sp. 51]|uniref:IS200/IS605 family transposase n=1 Tax=Bacteroides sp. 51 TaxID=2302938 RepID=UPI0013D44B5B|nr:IS200/IS605 family transposase [Bacteroides sp. 51]NDV84968.1 IS200/IS605 family transposase [Bacteroides sp. 51]